MSLAAYAAAMTAEEDERDVIYVVERSGPSMGTIVAAILVAALVIGGVVWVVHESTTRSCYEQAQDFVRDGTPMDADCR